MQNTYWFPAKRYGWGWGLPITWEGWLTLSIFFGLLAVVFLIFPPRAARGAFLIYVMGLSVLLVAVVWFKGEPPHWRWGND